MPTACSITRPASSTSLHPERIVQRILNGTGLEKEEALEWATSPALDWEELLRGANALRRYYFKDQVVLTTLLNAKSGACSEDCHFCGQSARYRTPSPIYPIVPKEEFQKAYQRAGELKAQRLCIAFARNELTRTEFDHLCDALQSLDRSQGIDLCASLGKLTPERIQRLKNAGINRIHHNLETSERYFPEICSTHTYQDRLDCIADIKAQGMELCSGGIFGLGETWEDRVEMAYALKEVDPQSIPLNFLVTIAGTPLANQPRLAPREILKIIALYRYIHPTKELRVSGGREYNLRDLQSWLFYAGGSSIVVGGYLTVKGRQTEEDFQMLEDLRLKIK